MWWNKRSSPRTSAVRCSFCERSFTDAETVHGPSMRLAICEDCSELVTNLFRLRREPPGPMPSHDVAASTPASGGPTCAQGVAMSTQLTSVQPVLMSRDVEASIAFYGRMGFEECFRDHPTAPRYAAIRRDGIELHLQWHDATEWAPGQDRPTYRFVVQDVDALFAEFRERDALSPTSAVRDTPWGTSEFHVQDPDRNGLQFYRSLTSG